MMKMKKEDEDEDEEEEEEKKRKRNKKKKLLWNFCSIQVFCQVQTTKENLSQGSQRIFSDFDEVWGIHC